MSVVTPIRDRSEARTPTEPPRRGRHPEAPDRGELDPRYLEAVTPGNGSPREAPDAGDVDLDHGRSQS
jgi:hypothetical protein